MLMRIALRAADCGYRPTHCVVLPRLRPARPYVAALTPPSRYHHKKRSRSLSPPPAIALTRLSQVSSQASGTESRKRLAICTPL